MPHEPRIDRIEFQKDVGYFSLPVSEFLVFDNGSLIWEPPEKYRLYTNMSEIDTIIVKVGTSIITHRDYRMTIYNMNCLSEDLTRIKEGRKLNVLLVTSGAIGLGRKARLRRGEKIPEKEKNTPEQKRRDAIEGQSLLYELWRHHFYPQLVEESLVTHEDIKNEQKNAMLSIKYRKWLSEGKIPIINEDDAKSLEEIDISLKGERVFRDNDGLASLHAQFLKKAGYNPLLIILSNTDGIYTKSSCSRYTPIRVVKNPAGLEEQALPISSARGRGGVVSKIEACRDAALYGISSAIANGQYCNHDSPYQKRKAGSERKYDVLDSVLDGRVAGTRFLL